MKYSDETLMAFADGALDPQSTRELEQAMLADPALAAAVDRHRALRADVFAAFAPVLDEAVPARLSRAASATGVLAPPGIGQVLAARPGWSWPQWGGLAAMLVLGVTLGRLTGTEQQGGWMAPAGKDGALVAQGPLAQELTQQLAGTVPAGAGARIGISFVAKDGRYCRSFAVAGSAGLACQQAGQWQIAVMAAASGQTGEYRQAGAAMPPAVLEAIDERIAGPALDARAEAAAQAANWLPRSK
jgi:hypothetical protein